MVTITGKKFKFNKSISWSKTKINTGNKYDLKRPIES